MKKILMLIIFFALATTSHAQVTGGAKAGFTMSSYAGDKKEGSVDQRPRPGFHFGVYFNFKLSEKFSFQPELLLSTAGSKWTEIIELENSELVKLEITERLAYLSIPVSLKYSIGHFSVHAGPQVSFLLEAGNNITMTRISGGNVIIVSGIATAVENLKVVDVGLNFGAEINFGKLGVGARYTMGMTDLKDTEDGKTTNDLIQVSLMYKLLVDK